MRVAGIVLAFVAAGTLAGCAGSPVHLSTLSDDELLAQPVPALLHAWRFTGNDRYRAAIQQLGVFTEAEWALIDAQKITIGSRVEVLYASWGNPSRENRTTTASGTHVQHVYFDRAYVYSENGIVTGIQH